MNMCKDCAWITKSFNDSLICRNMKFLLNLDEDSSGCPVWEKMVIKPAFMLIDPDMFGQAVRDKRGKKTVGNLAKEIDVSSATILRVERGNTPSLFIFNKINKWLIGTN